MPLTQDVGTLPPQELATALPERMSPLRHPATRIAARSLIRPFPLLAGVALALAPLAWARLAPLGIAIDSDSLSGLVYELAFMGALVGTLAGVHGLEEWTWLTRRWLPAETLRFEAAVLGLAAAVLAGLPLLASLPGMPLWPSGALGTLALGVFQLVAAGLLLRRLPLPAGARLLALLAVCWWIPSALAPSLPFGLGLAPRALASAGGAGPALLGPRTWVAGTSLGIALLLAARLEPGRAARRP